MLIGSLLPTPRPFRATLNDERHRGSCPCMPSLPLLGYPPATPRSTRAAVADILTTPYDLFFPLSHKEQELLYASSFPFPLPFRFRFVDRRSVAHCFRGIPPHAYTPGNSTSLSPPPVVIRRPPGVETCAYVFSLSHRFAANRLALTTYSSFRFCCWFGLPPPSTYTHVRTKKSLTDTTLMDAYVFQHMFWFSVPPSIV